MGNKDFEVNKADIKVIKSKLYTKKKKGNKITLVVVFSGAASLRIDCQSGSDHNKIHVRCSGGQYLSLQKIIRSFQVAANAYLVAFYNCARNQTIRGVEGDEFEDEFYPE